MPPTIDLSDTMGALLIGILFSVCLFGMTTLQTWYYFQHYPNDNMVLKSVVTVVWIFECFHVIFGCHAIYYYLVLNYANPEGLGVSVWSANLTLLFTAIITLIVHSFFAWRVWILGRGSLIMPSIIMVGAIANSALTLTTVAISFQAVEFSEFPHSIDITSSTALALAVATDLTIAGSLGYYLHKGRSGYSKTDHLINKLIFWAVNVGILTSSADLVVLISSEAQSNLVFLAVFEVVGNLYANSMLATLNIRANARGQVLREDGRSMELSFKDTAVSSKVPNSSVTVWRKEEHMVSTNGQEIHSNNVTKDGSYSNTIGHFGIGVPEGDV